MYEADSEKDSRTGFLLRTLKKKEKTIGKSKLFK